ncbi:hypothetical protein PP637_gp60 [Arthrobacter phage Persistence]|uniref:Uncharacterized protein n=1 Tax=Arthrobacter phage Persistence TaxID=2836007 RepID=A0A8F3IM19_9CAUD|nr:hypothetical protein PP637_gp60 [Arthrobacter phage Persistence]QWY79689.1 hypothetical protein SEA_PERSISTENCE_60 [Arthrobacter phage Persistence]
MKCADCGRFTSPSIGHICSKNSQTTHDPTARPLGCNGKYGDSGRQQHKKAGTDYCTACRESSAHYRREIQRGGIKVRTPQPCGTYAAAARHAYNKEPLDFACRIARANYRADLKAKK